jgi:hypothetical protein
MQEGGVKDDGEWLFGLSTPRLQHNTVEADLRAYGHQLWVCTFGRPTHQTEDVNTLVINYGYAHLVAPHIRRRMST